MVLYAPTPLVRTSYTSPAAIKYEAFPRSGQMNTSQGLTSGTLMLTAVALPAGVVVNNISFSSATTAAGTPTHWWFGLYDSSLVQLATTADQTTTAWAASTVKTLSIATIAAGASATFTTTYEGLYYIGALVVATTTPTLSSVTMMNGPAGLTPRLTQTSDSSQTTPPAFPHTATSGSLVTGIVYGGVA